MIESKGVKYSDISRIHTCADAADALRLGKPVFKVGWMYVIGERKTAEVFARARGEKCEVIRSKRGIDFMNDPRFDELIEQEAW